MDYDFDGLKKILLSVKIKNIRYEENVAYIELEDSSVEPYEYTESPKFINENWIGYKGEQACF